MYLVNCSVDKRADILEPGSKLSLLAGPQSIVPAPRHCEHVWVTSGGPGLAHGVSTGPKARPVPKLIIGCWQTPRVGSLTWGRKSHHSGDSQAGACEPDPHPIQEWERPQRSGCRGGDPITACVYFSSVAPLKTRQIRAEGDKLQVTNPTEQQVP